MDVLVSDGVALAAAAEAVDVKSWRIASYPLQYYYRISIVYQRYLDKISPHLLYRWIVTALLAILYALRIYVQGFYIFTIVLVGFHLSTILFKFLSAHVDPEMEGGGPVLPIKDSDEFKPLIRQLHEFNFWYGATRDLCLALTITFFPLFDVGGPWIIPFICWFLMFSDKLFDLIIYSRRFKYNPFTLVKQ